MKKIIENLKATMMVAAFAAMSIFTACSSNDSKDENVPTVAKSGKVTMTCYATDALPKYANAKFVYTINGEEKSIGISESDWKTATKASENTAFEASKTIDINSIPQTVKVRVEFTPKDSTQLTLGTEEYTNIGAGFKVSAETKDANSQTIKAGTPLFASGVDVQRILMGKPSSFKSVFAYVNLLSTEMANKTCTTTLNQDGTIQ